MRVYSYHTVSSIINERGSDKRVLRAFNQFLCNKKLQKRLNFQDFSCSYNIVKLLLTCNTIKAQIVLIKLSYTYNICCHGNSCAYGLYITFKTGYFISNALYGISVCWLFVQSMQLQTHKIYRNMEHS